MSDRGDLSNSSTLLLALSILLIGAGLAASLGFAGQCALELPYHLYGKETSAIVGSTGILEEAEITVYYYSEEQPGQMLSSNLRGASRMPQGSPAQGARINIVYIPGKSEEVMPLEVVQRAGQEVLRGLVVGGALILPGLAIWFWLKNSGRMA